MKPIWMDIAEAELGVTEIPGPEAEGRIVEYLESTSLGHPDNQTDETPWCSAFVNWCMVQAGYQGTDSAWARSWLNWGREPEEEEYEGCICILSRGKGSGHVGFLTEWDDESVILLGGNQSNQVCYATYPVSRVLGYRVP
jgi:uncharacterized protein (TIGR02594 family)